MSEPDGSAQETPRPQDGSTPLAAAGNVPKGGRIGIDAHAGSSAPSTASAASRRSLGTRGVSRRDSLRRRSSGLFAAARASFYRSRGNSGASVETLRGNTGADFEGYATVHRGDDDSLAFFDLSSLLCCGGGEDGLYYLLIKGYHCFVFKDEAGKSPKYAVELLNRRAVVQPPHLTLIPHVPHPGAKRDTTSFARGPSRSSGYTTVHLETGLGDVEYKFTFADTEDGLAAKFCSAVAAAAGAAANDQVKKRLGHEGLLGKHASVRYAENIGKEKTKDQPETRVKAGEVLAQMPVPTY